MKFYLCIGALIIYVVAILLSPLFFTPEKVRPARADVGESSCSMPMCESFGGHDAIAIDFMFGG